MLILTKTLKMMIILHRLIVVVAHRASFNVNLIFIIFAIFFPLNFYWIFFILNKKIVFFIKWASVNCVIIMIIIFETIVFAWFKFSN